MPLKTAVLQLFADLLQFISNIQQLLSKNSIFADLEAHDFEPSAFQGTDTMWDGFGRHQSSQINGHLLSLILNL